MTLGKLAKKQALVSLNYIMRGLDKSEFVIPLGLIHEYGQDLAQYDQDHMKYAIPWNERY